MKYGTEFHGPFIEQFKVTSHGYQVPNLTAYKLPSGYIALTLDERFAIEGTEEEVSKWVPFLANAMAVAAGYTCHGENCNTLNPFTCKLGPIDFEDIGN